MAIAVLARRFSTNEQFQRTVLEWFDHHQQVRYTAFAELDVSKHAQDARQLFAEFARPYFTRVDAGDDVEAVLSKRADELWPDLATLSRVDTKVAEHLITVAFESNPRSLGWTVDLESDIDLGPGRLVVSGPAAYERWDQLRGEAEFRLSVVPPLIALIVVLRHWLTGPIVAVSTIPIVVLLALGLQKGRLAQEQLRAAIEAKVIESLALAKLTTDENLFVVESQDAMEASVMGLPASPGLTGDKAPSAPGESHPSSERPKPPASPARASEAPTEASAD
jgi:hypothetical protein